MIIKDEIKENIENYICNNSNINIIYDFNKVFKENESVYQIIIVDNSLDKASKKILEYTCNYDFDNFYVKVEKIENNIHVISVYFNKNIDTTMSKIQMW